MISFFPSSSFTRRNGFLCLFWVSLVIFGVVLSPPADLAIIANLRAKQKVLPNDSDGHTTVDLFNRSTPVQSSFSLWIPAEPKESIRDKVLAAIDGVKPVNQSRFATCPITCQLQITESQDGTWLLRTYDEKGQRKTVGGDEFYIQFTHADAPTDPNANITHATAIARAHDLRNGIYQLSFVTSPLLEVSLSELANVGRLTIHMEYTCGVGFMGQPTKNEWHTGGSVNEHFVLINVPSPPIRLFEPPEPTVNLAKYQVVYVLGDSVMNNFVGTDWDFFGRSNMVKHKSPASALNSLTVHEWIAQFHRDFESELEAYRDEFKTSAASNSSTTPRPKVAFLTASSTWDLLRNDVDQWMTFEDHLGAIEKLVTAVRRAYPFVDILWKSATSLHICNPDIEEMARQSKEWGIDRVRYMSESRSRHLDGLQKELMAKLGVPVLDMYEASYLAADYARTPTDARHYDWQFNRMVNSWFFW